VSPSTIAISMVNGHQNDTATDLDFDIGTFPSMDVIKNMISLGWMNKDNGIKVMSKSFS
jgi:hypothetical protein